LLFKKLPDEIFRPLAGPNRYLFEEVLLFLFKYLSDEDLTNEAIFPRRSLVKSEIEELLARKGRMLHIVIEDGVSGGEAISDHPAQAANYIYSRLVQTGWLEEEEEGYNVNVLMPPHANLLLEALVEVATAEKKNYGGTVASINLQLEAIVRLPQENAHAFVEVVRSAREFTRHLQNILSGLRGFQEIIASHRDPRLALATFFDDFVENLLISDYKSLQSENNPFRHRSRVLQNLLYIEYSSDILECLLKVYQDDKKLPLEKARNQVIQDLHFITRVFQSVDRRLTAIDRYRVRLESRVTEMVRYLDRSVPDLAERGMKLLGVLGATSLQHPTADLDNLPAPSKSLEITLMGPKSLRGPRKRREEQVIELVKRKELSPEVRQRRQLAKEYLRRRTITPAKISAFLLKQMGDQQIMSAKEFTIETAEDLMAFCFAPFMSKTPGYTIKRTGGRIENEWLEGPDFVVEKKVVTYAS